MNVAHDWPRHWSKQNCFAVFRWTINEQLKEQFKICSSLKKNCLFEGTMVISSNNTLFFEGTIGSTFDSWIVGISFKDKVVLSSNEVRFTVHITRDYKVDIYLGGQVGAKCLECTLHWMSRVRPTIYKAHSPADCYIRGQRLLKITWLIIITGLCFARQ